MIVICYFLKYNFIRMLFYVVFSSQQQRQHLFELKTLNSFCTHFLSATTFANNAKNASPNDNIGFMSSNHVDNVL